MSARVVCVSTRIVCVHAQGYSVCICKGSVFSARIVCVSKGSVYACKDSTKCLYALDLGRSFATYRHESGAGDDLGTTLVCACTRINKISDVY